VIFLLKRFSYPVSCQSSKSAAFPNLQVYAANMAQASAPGAALAVHDPINKTGTRPDLIQLKHYAAKENLYL
jgi:hypothetical protein